MASSLLIGNGLNLANDNIYLYPNNIYERFLNILKDKIWLFEKCLYLEKVDFDNLKQYIGNENIGIEQLSGKVFSYFCKLIQNKGELNWNFCYRLTELLGCTSIEAIFIVNGKFEIPKVSEKYIKKLEMYKQLFTLNYVENWANNSNIIYLHGSLEKYFKNYNSELIISNILAHTSEINIDLTNSIKLDFKDIIFIPENDLFDKYIYVGEGLTLNKCGLIIFPANDLFLYSGKGDIYKDLDNINELDIFGMSPFGDVSLIKKISKIEKVTIYIYNDNEIDEWKKYIPNAIFKNSDQFCLDIE